MKVDVSVGELIDKITILRIKKAKIQDTAKLANIDRELYALLTEQLVYYRDLPAELREQLDQLEKQLEQINLKLWMIEDFIREKEHLQQFDDEFIQLARNVYFTNDMRSGVKRTINTISNSPLVEEKSYVQY